MKTRLFVSFAVSALLLPILAVAQEIVVPQPADFEFGPEPGNVQPFYAADAFFDPFTQSYQLTSNSKTTGSRTFMYPKFSFCAEDYLITYEALINGPIPTSGEVRVGVFYDKSGAKDAQAIVELDTFQDGGPSMPYGKHEINNNHIAIETQLGTVNGGFDGKAGWDTFTYVVQEPPFLLAGTSQEWTKVQIRNDKGDITVDAVKGSKYLKLFAKSEYRSNTPLYLSAEASTRPTWTGYSAPQQKIRNLKIHILKSCSSDQTPTEILTQVDPNNELSQCPVNDAAIAQVTDELSRLRSVSAINQSQYEEVLNLVSNRLNFCNGSMACKSDLDALLANEYQNGYQAGKNSVQCPVDSGNKDKEGKKKITICHLAANGKGNTISISESAWQAHQKHGDVLGECPKLEEKGKAKK